MDRKLITAARTATLVRIMPLLEFWRRTVSCTAQTTRLLRYCDARHKARTSQKADAAKRDAGKRDTGKRDTGKRDTGKRDTGKRDMGKRDMGDQDGRR